MATIAVDIYVGWLFLISGFVGLIAVFSARNVPAFLWTLLTAALSLVVGLVTPENPAKALYRSPPCLLHSLFPRAFSRSWRSFTYRDVVPNSWGWMLVSGIADLVLSAIIIYSWPLSATWMLGLIVGANLIT